LLNRAVHWIKAAPLARRQRRALPWARPPHAGPHTGRGRQIKAAHYARR
jgi:hypothetical protein